MATVTLGNIKFNWKGAWNSGTAYVIDDVVSLSGSSYVSIQAGTNQNPASASAYWQQMSSAGTNGTNGTDLTTTLTAQGDIVYRDGSGLAKLGAGTSGQFLKTLGTGANPIWGDAGGGVLQVKYSHQYFSTSTTSSSYVDTGQQVIITPTSASSKILLMAAFCVQVTNNRGEYTFNKSGDASGNGDLNTNINASADSLLTHEGTSNRNTNTTMMFLDHTVASTNALTYKTRHKIGSAETSSFGQIGGNGIVMYAIEIDGGIVS